MAPEAILPDLLAAFQLVPADPGQDVSPDDPVQEAESEDSPAGDGVRPVRQVHVRVAARWRLDEWNDEEEDVRGTEERGGAHSPQRGTLPVGVWPDVQVDDAEGDDGVDDGERVGDLQGSWVSLCSPDTEKEMARTELRTKL